MKIPFTEPTVRDRQGASTESAACDHPGSHHEPAVCDHPGFTPLARATIPSEAVRKAAGGLQRFRPGGQTSAGLLVVLAFRRLLAGGQKLCHQHNFRGVRSSENIGFLGDLPRSLRRGAVGMLRTTSTRSPVCPAGRSPWRSPAAFRPGIHNPSPKTPIYDMSLRKLSILNDIIR